MTSAATKTTDTIRYMVAANLAFMLDPVLREAVTPGPGMFSPAEFVRDGGTLYLIAESRDERPSPVAGPVRRPGHRDLPRGGPGRGPDAGRAAGPADAVGAG